MKSSCINWIIKEKGIYIVCLEIDNDLIDLFYIRTNGEYNTNEEIFQKNN